MTLMIVSTSLVTAVLCVCYRKRHAGNCGPMWYIGVITAVWNSVQQNHPSACVVFHVFKFFVNSKMHPKLDCHHIVIRY